MPSKRRFNENVLEQGYCVREDTPISRHFLKEFLYLKGTFLLSLSFDERHGHCDNFFHRKTHAPGVFFKSFSLGLRLWRFAYLCLIRPEQRQRRHGRCVFGWLGLHTVTNCTRDISQPAKALEGIFKHFSSMRTWLYARVRARVESCFRRTVQGCSRLARV